MVQGEAGTVGSNMLSWCKLVVQSAGRKVITVLSISEMSGKLCITLLQYDSFGSYL